MIAAAREMADGAELLLDVTDAAPGGPGPTEVDGAMLGVLLALADLTVDQQRDAER